MNEFSVEDSPIKSIKLYNNSGIEVFEVLINGFEGNLVSPSLDWFKLTFIEDNFEDSDTIYGAIDYLEVR